MGGGGGGGESRGYGALPWWAEGAHRSLIRQGEEFAYGDRGSFVPFQEPRIAQFTDPELAAQAARQQLYNQGDPASEWASQQLGMAAGLAPEMQQFAQSTAGIASRDLSPLMGSWVDADRQAYMNPYVEDVLNPQLREAREDFERQLNRTQAENIAQGGAIGSYRMGLQDALLRAQRAQTLSDIRGKGMYDAYRDAAGLYSRDQDVGLQQRSQEIQKMLADIQAQREGIGGLQSAANLYQTTAAGASQLGMDEQQRALTNIAELERSGAVQREMQQRELDLAYQDFLEERDFPMQRMQFLSQILSGVPAGALAQTTTTSPQPGLVSQLASLGIGAAGLAQLFGKQQA